MKLMWLRHASACDRCVAPLEPNTQAWWDRRAAAVVCRDCHPVGPPPMVDLVGLEGGADAVDRVHIDVRADADRAPS